MSKFPPPTYSGIETLEARIAPATLTVTSTADSGPGSLRQAILDANALPGADTIGFNIDGDQLQVIALESPLPAITEQLTISALASRYDARTEYVRIDGTNAGEGADGLQITASNCVVAGLSIANFSGTGVHIKDGSSNTVFLSYISSNGEHGVHFDGGQDNRIFWSTVGTYSDVIGFGSGTGNKGDGVLVENAKSTFIAPPQLTTSIGGISFEPYGIRSGNKIVGNGLFGIEIRESESVVVAGNELRNNGALATETKPGGGISILDSQSVNIGALYEYRAYPSGFDHNEKTVLYNLISSNVGHGVWIRGQETSGTTIANNFINDNVSGDGVRIDGATDTQFGLSFEDGYWLGGSPIYIRVSGEKMNGNTISGNSGWGIAAVNGASDIVVQGSTFEGNGSGALLFDHVSGAVIGGLETFSWTTTNTITNRHSTSYTYSANILNFGTAEGIAVKESEGVQITSNSFAGTGTPIDLGGDGATQNDPGDGDSGTNHLQNHPTLTGTDSQLTASLDTDAANTTFRIQLFKFDPTTGYSLHSTQTVTTGANGKAAMSFGSIALSAGQTIHATATNLTTGETSEMSTAAIIKPNVTITPATITEGNSGSQNLTFTISLSSTTTVPVKVSYRTVDSTAIAGEDYAAVESFVVFEPGETSKSISIPVFGDSVQETNERFNLKLTAVENGVISSWGEAIGTIVNDDALPTVSIQSTPITVFEGTSASFLSIAGQYTITLSNPSLEPVTVRVRTVAGTATPGYYVNSDYQTIDELVTFAPGTTSLVKSFTVTTDGSYENTPEETFTIQISNPSTGLLGNSSTVVTIVEDDGWLLESYPVSVIEGNDGYNFAVMQVRLISHPSVGLTDHAHTVTVDFTTLGDSAGVDDFVATQGKLVFLPGEFEKTITIPVIADTTPEFDERFRINFSNALGANIAHSRDQWISIVNDDAGTISGSAASIIEGNNGQKMLVFTVGLSASPSTPVSVNFETESGTAIAGIDFEAIAGTLTFAPGETTKTISVPIFGDRTAEQAETFKLKLTNATGGATIATAVLQGTITNDDPTLSIENAQFQEGQPSNPGTRSVYLPVRLSQATDIPVSVDYTFNDGTAEATSDYIGTNGTLVFAAGQTLQFIEIKIVGDLAFESNESFSVILSNAQGAEIAQSSGVVTIQNDDAPIIPADLVISKGGRRATWTEIDGDVVTLTATKGVLTSSSFLFHGGSEGLPLFLGQLDVGFRGDAAPLGLKFSVKKSVSGDGLVHVGEINANGRDLTEVTLPGRLGAIVAGDNKLKTPAIRKLIVDSFGLDGASIDAGKEPLSSIASGSIGSFAVKHDFAGANLLVSGGGIQSLSIGGNIVGSASSFPTGISVEKALGTLRVGGDIQGGDPLHPVEIKAGQVPLTRGVEAFHLIQVGGSVTHTDITAGSINQGVVKIGAVQVKGDWTASNLIAGAGAGDDGLFGTGDDTPLPGTASSIARITIRGAVSGTAEAENGTDSFGFVAGRIAAFQVGASKTSLTSKWKDSMALGTTSDVFLLELAGRVRA